eukprot:TRINITY_DN74199_c0_g1_i1.p1 TRINITY_DN74199_c0_g1~~TRINITY_DN74199_c0_g1_i1.p1  ORF type:complete len:467 (-),score=68.49 TRINITY_DN74199_c0_g1_i1:26-1426(-)
MDYFALGGKPFLSQFPPHISGILVPNRLQELQLQEGQQAVVDGQSQTLHALQVLQQAQAQAHAQAFHHHAQVQAAAAASDSAQPYPRSEALGFLFGGNGMAALSHPIGGDDLDEDDGLDKAVGSTSLPSRTLCDEERHPVAPKALHQGYDPSRVLPWDSGRFKVIRKLQDASRNRGQVLLMEDHQEARQVAVKQMPSRWVLGSHAEFVIEHPSETELPWQDVGCVSFLNRMGYPYACDLLGVYRDEVHTYVVTSLASEGDLFSWCEGGVSAGPEREKVVHPIARQILEGVQLLHDFGIVHRDLSMENILISKDARDGTFKIHIIDFSMASTSRNFRNCVRGKASYQAPELHSDVGYDAYVSDAFSVGVTLYAVLLKDYPWLSTRTGGCKCFEYVRKNGFRAYLAKRKLRSSTQRVAEFMSEPLVQLLEGLLRLEPAQRLTLGERKWQGQRRSVWDEPWVREGPGNA